MGGAAASSAGPSAKLPSNSQRRALCKRCLVLTFFVGAVGSASRAGGWGLAQLVHELG